MSLTRTHSSLKFKLNFCFSVILGALGLRRFYVAFLQTNTMFKFQSSFGFAHFGCVHFFRDTIGKYEATHVDTQNSGYATARVRKFHAIGTAIGR